MGWTEDTTLPERFWAKVSKGPDCWEWTGATVNTGYGVVRAGGKASLAHRVAWFLVHGEEPSDFVLHQCDNRLCVRPDHLEVGSAKDNSQQMVDRGRSQRGSGHYAAKITEQEAGDIRSAYAAGETQTQLAARYGLHQSTVSVLVRERTWKHV